MNCNNNSDDENNQQKLFEQCLCCSLCYVSLLEKKRNVDVYIIQLVRAQKLNVVIIITGGGRGDKLDC